MRPSLRASCASTSAACPELPRGVLQAALRGSPSAMSRLHHHYRPRVRRAVERVARVRGRGDDIEELCQETWCRLLANEARLLRYFDPVRGGFGAFVSRLARQQAARAIRAELRHRRERVELGEGGIDRLQADAGALELTRAVLAQQLRHHARGCLHPHDQALLLRCHVGDLPLGELALELGVSRHALYKRNQRLPAKLLGMRERLGAPARPRPTRARGARSS